MRTPCVNDFTSALIEDRYDDMLALAGLTNHWATAQVDHDVVAVRSLNVPPLSQGDSISGRLYLGGRLAQSWGEPVFHEWRPDRVQRSTTVDGWQVDTVTVCPPGMPGVVVRLSIENTTGSERELRVGLWIDSTVTRSPQPWLQAAPPQEDNVIAVEGARRIGRPGTAACSMQGLVDAHGRDVADVRGTARMIETVHTLAPGETAEFGYVHVVAGDENEARSWFEAAASDIDAHVAASEQAWNDELTALFTPANDLYSGWLPALHTDNDDVRTLYWWGAMGVAWFRRDNPASVLGRVYDTLMPRYWQTTTFIWDYSLSSQVHALLDPDVMRRQLSHWVGLDINSHFGTEWLTGSPVGYWYSVNQYALTRLVADLLRHNDAADFLGEQVAGPDGSVGTILDHLVGWARAWEDKRGASGLADYGDIDNLLECVSSYVHEVASLQGANAWCMRTAAEVLDMRGDADKAARLRTDADALIPLIEELYVPGAGHFRARQPDGSLHEAKHCYDFSTLGTTIASDLGPEVGAEMVRFFVDELQTPSWMRALSPFDEDAGFSLRPDHQWNGAYPAWPADSARAALALGGADAVLEWLPGLARTTKQGPPGQAHFVEEAWPSIEGGARKAPSQFPYLIDWSCSSAGAWCELVINGLFGVEVGVDGRVVSAGGPIARLDPNARLTGLRTGAGVVDVDADGRVSGTPPTTPEDHTQ